MALTPQEIHQLDQEIFDFLYAKHLEAKEKGEEFYFDIFPHKNNEGIFYWSNYPKNEPFILFWDFPFSEIALFISKNKSKHYESKCIISLKNEVPTYLIDDKNKRILMQNLISSLCKENREWKKEDSIDYTYYIKKYKSAENIRDSIDNFLSTDKIQINSIIKEIQARERNSQLGILSKEVFETMCSIGRFLNKLPQSFPKDDALFLSLSRFIICKYQGIEELEINEIMPNTRFIFLTGENATGKTTILNCLYYMLKGDRNIKNILNLGLGYCVDIFKNKSYLRNYAYTYSDKTKIDSFISQININEKVLALGLTNVEDQANNGHLENLVRFLYDRKKSTKRAYQYDLLVNIFNEFLPNLSRIEVDIDMEAEEYEKAVLFYEKDENGNELGSVTFDKLAMGHRNILNMVANIVVGLSYEKEKTLEFLHPKDLYGIVIIDEFEQHLHPKMQRFLVEKLTTLFPKVQFIVSTHSPIPLLGAPKESVILHVERTKEKGITVQQLTEIDFSNLLPEALLSLVFDFDDFIPRKYDKMNPFETESDANELIFDKMLKDKVQKLADKNGKKLADFFTKK
jgi:predicted ATPase